MAIEVKAPNPWPTGHFVIFLAGAIDMGAAKDWQSEIAKALAEFDVVILNPRRDDWDSTWDQTASDPQFREQVLWEQKGLDEADFRTFVFLDDSKAPITLLELGEHIGEPGAVLCEPEFYRKGNVDISSALNKMPVFESLDALIGHIAIMLEQKGLKKAKTAAAKPNFAGFTAAWRKLTKPSGGADTDVRVWEDTVTIDLHHVDDAIYINKIESNERRSGNASRALRAICNLADRFHTPIELSAYSDEGDNSLSDSALIAWYERNGFVRDPDPNPLDYMRRAPHGSSKSASAAGCNWLNTSAKTVRLKDLESDFEDFNVLLFQLIEDNNKGKVDWNKQVPVHYMPIAKAMKDVAPWGMAGDDGDERGEPHIAELMKSMQSGMLLPPAVTDEKGDIIDGRHRIHAASRLGVKQIPFIRLDEIQKAPTKKPAKVASREDLDILKSELTLTPAQQGEELARSYDRDFREFIKDQHPELEEHLPTDEDDYLDDYSAFPADVLTEFREEYGPQYAQYPDAPTFLTVEFERDVNDEWLVHFTDHATAIAAQGFKYGMDDPRTLALTTHFTDKAKQRGGYNFAFSTAQPSYYLNGKKYGRDCVVFKASGIMTFHYGDNEPQVIFWGADAHDIVPVIQDSNSGYWTLYDGDGNVLFESGKLGEAIDWVEENYEFYHAMEQGETDLMRQWRERIVEIKQDIENQKYFIKKRPNGAADEEQKQELAELEAELKEAEQAYQALLPKKGMPVAASAKVADIAGSSAAVMDEESESSSETEAAKRSANLLAKKTAVVTPNPFYQALKALTPQMAAAAQKIYDEWEQGDEDDDFGGGGICDAIAQEISSIIVGNIADVELIDGGQDGDDHAWVIAGLDGKAYGVDIAPGVYETGSGYSWTKRPGVTFDASDVDIFAIPYKDAFGEGTSITAATQPVGPPSSGFQPWFHGDNSETPEYSPVKRPVTESGEFLKWFGDSKVRDEHNDPLTCFHATSHEGKMFSNRGKGYGQFGHWFDTAPHSTERYLGGDLPSDQPNMIPVFLSIHNPKVFPDTESFKDAVNGKFGPNVPARAQKLRTDLKKQGYDGALINNASRGGVDYWVAFDTKQIKSAIGNSGEFSTTDKSIMASIETPAVMAAELSKTSAKLQVYRGEGPASQKNGKFWTTDPEFAVQFTRQGLHSELRRATIDDSVIYRADPLPYGGDPDQMDEAIEKARAEGFKAIWCSEGNGEPESIYVFNRAALHSAYGRAASKNPWLRRTEPGYYEGEFAGQRIVIYKGVYRGPDGGRAIGWTLKVDGRSVEDGLPSLKDALYLLTQFHSKPKQATVAKCGSCGCPWSEHYHLPDFSCKNEPGCGCKGWSDKKTAKVAASRERVIREAQQYANQFEEGHPAHVDPEQLEWVDESAFDLHKIAGFDTDASDWKWLVRDVWDRAKEGNSLDEAKKYYDAMKQAVKDGTMEPIIVVEGTDGKFYIWDGNHRVALAHELHVDKLPAWVGFQPKPATKTVSEGEAEPLEASR